MVKIEEQNYHFCQIQWHSCQTVVSHETIETDLDSRYNYSVVTSLLLSSIAARLSSLLTHGSIHTALTSDENECLPIAIVSK